MEFDQPMGFFLVFWVKKWIEKHRPAPRFRMSFETLFEDEGCLHALVVGALCRGTATAKGRFLNAQLNHAYKKYKKHEAHIYVYIEIYNPFHSRGMKSLAQQLSHWHWQDRNKTLGSRLQKSLGSPHLP